MIFKRPVIHNRLTLCCAVFTATVVAFLNFNNNIALGIVAAAIIALAIILLTVGEICKKRFYVTVPLLFATALGMILCCGANYAYRRPAQMFLEKYENVECNMTVEIESAEISDGNYASYNVNILECNGEFSEPFFGEYLKMKVTDFGNGFSEKGDVIRIKAVPRRPEKKTDSGFEQERYLESQRIFIVCDCSENARLIYKKTPNLADKLQSKLAENLTKYIGKRTVTDETFLARCMLLGDKSGISKELKNVFRAAGISHVLSVSGLHLSILFAALSTFLNLKNRTPRRRFPCAEILSCVLIYTYMAVAGFKPSVMRAGFMIIFINIHSVLTFYKRKLGFNFRAVYNGENYDYNYFDINNKGVFDSVTALFCAGTLICIISPYAVYDVGMQLSFMATLGILIGGPITAYAENKLRFAPLKAIFTSFAITFSAVSFTLPISVYYFGELSLMSAFSNILITPVMTLLLALLLALAMIGFLPSFSVTVSVCSFLGNICEFLCGLCIKIAKTNSKFKFSVLKAENGVFSNVVFAALLALTLAALFLKMNKVKKFGFVSIVFFYFACSAVYFANTVQEYSKPKLSFCTLKKLPYSCLSFKDKRIVFDSGEGLSQLYETKRVMGEQLFKTENIYVVAFKEKCSLNDIYFNITYFDENEKISVLYLPNYDVFKNVGVDNADYGEFVSELIKRDFGIVIYDDEFTVDGIDFKTEMTQTASSFVFENYSLIFANNYDSKTANKLSCDSDYCIYFCKNAQESHNKEYISQAELYVSSSHYKKINGAQKIPTRKPDVR